MDVLRAFCFGYSLVLRLLHNSRKTRLRSGSAAKYL
jgi:hypothetical protein